VAFTCIISQAGSIQAPFDKICEATKDKKQYIQMAKFISLVTTSLKPPFYNDIIKIPNPTKKRGVEKYNNVEACLSRVLAIPGGPLDPLFCLSDHCCLSYTVFLKCFRSLLQRFRYYPQNYGGHSFRKGAATWAGSVGLSDYDINMLAKITFILNYTLPHTIN
jgi:hypothetical protein